MRVRQLLLAAGMLNAVATGGALAAGPAVDGPFVVTGGEVVEVGLSFGEAAVRAVLPKGLEPAEGFTGGIDVYTVAHGWGMGPYTAGYLWLDLAQPSPDGSPARYMVKGFYSEKFRALASLHQAAIGAGSGVLAVSGDTVTASAGPEGAPVLHAVVKPDASKCTVAVEGMGDYVWLAESGLTVMHIPTVADVCEAAPVSADVTDADGPLAALKPTAILWAVVAHNGAVAFAPPEPLSP